MSNVGARKPRSPRGRPSARRRPSALRRPSGARNRRPSAARRPPNKDEEGIPKCAPIDFCQKALKKNARGKLELVDQFRKYKNEQVHNFNKNIQRTAFDANKTKNRYPGEQHILFNFVERRLFSVSDVLCGDAGRVKLQDGMDGDYM